MVRAKVIPSPAMPSTTERTPNADSHLDSAGAHQKSQFPWYSLRFLISRLTVHRRADQAGAAIALLIARWSRRLSAAAVSLVDFVVDLLHDIPEVDAPTCNKVRESDPLAHVWRKLWLRRGLGPNVFVDGRHPQSR